MCLMSAAFLVCLHGLVSYAATVEQDAAADDDDDDDDDDALSLGVMP